MTEHALKLVNPLKYPLIHILLLLVASAFLAGSITVGSEFTQSTARKTLASDAQRYKALVSQFKTNYQALPGDINNASTYWQDCRFESADCNGNGDGKITSSANDTTTEAALAWQHLSISGYIPKAYSGDLIGGYYVPNQNIPAAPYKDSGYLVTNAIPYTHASWGGSHFLNVGSMSNWRFDTPAASLSDAMAIDHKLDDGIASTGDIFAYSNEKHGCLDNYERQILVGKKVANYATHLDKGARCNVYFRLN